MPLGSNGISGGSVSEIGKRKVIGKIISGAGARFFAKYHVSASNLVLWLDQGDPQAGTSDATWDDLSGREVSGQDNDIEQQTASYQPAVTSAFPGYRDFDGSDNYMHQKVYEDQVDPAAVFWPTNAGAAFNATNARFRVAGVDLSPFASAANDYMLVIHDSADKTAWGYIDVVDSAEALGSELHDDSNAAADPNSTEADATAGWAADPTGGTVTSESDDPNVGTYYLKVVSGGAFEGILGDAGTFPCTVGKLYKIQFDIKTTSGTWTMSLRNSGDTSELVIFASAFASASYVSKNYYFVAPETQPRFKIVSNSGTALVDNISFKEVTHVGTDGVLIMSTKGGATQSWALQESGIDLNDIDSFEVLGSDFQHISSFFESWWVYCVDPTDFVIVDKLDATGNKGYRIGVDAADKPYCSIGDGTDTVTATWGSAISANTWYKISAGYDGTNAFVSVNNGTRVTAAQSVPADTYIIYKIGSDGTNYADGNIAVGIDSERSVSTTEDERLFQADYSRFL